MISDYEKFLLVIRRYTAIFITQREYTSLLNKIFHFSKLETDWDGYNADTPSTLTCIFAYNFATFLQHHKIVTPSIMLSSAGEISFFWKFNNNYIEVSIENTCFSYIVVEDKELISSYYNK